MTYELKLEKKILILERMLSQAHMIADHHGALIMKREQDDLLIEFQENQYQGAA